MKLRTTAALMAFALLLASCGGGGESTPPSKSEQDMSAPEKSTVTEVQEPQKESTILELLIQGASDVSQPKEELPPEQSVEPEQPEAPEQPVEPELPVIPEPVTVTGALDLSGYGSVPENALPDLLYWSEGAAEYDGEPSGNEDSQIYKYRTSMDVVEEYVDMLCRNGYTLVDSYAMKKLNSWGLMCDNAPDAGTISLLYTDAPCHVSIWTNGQREFRVDSSLDLTVCDTGIRRSGGAKDLTPEGPSAAEALIRLGDGSYQTADGRLTAAVGTAAVLRDGKSYTCQAKLVSDQDGGPERLWVENYYRNEGIYFENPASYLMTDDVFLLSDLSRERSYSTEKDGQDAYRWGGNYLSICHNGEWLTPVWNNNPYEALTVRVMYNDPGGDRVYYIYARFGQGEPTEIEALCAVDGGEKRGSLSDARYMAVGDTNTLRSEWEEFGSAYHVYEWEIVEGAGNVALESGGKNCRVTALRPGVAVIRQIYSYTTEEPDVLTGIPRDAGHERKVDYTFVIE